MQCPNESKSQWQSLSQVTTIYSTEKVTYIDLFEMVKDTKDFCILFILFERKCNTIISSNSNFPEKSALK